MCLGAWKVRTDCMIAQTMYIYANYIRRLTKNLKGE